MTVQIQSTHPLLYLYVVFRRRCFISEHILFSTLTPLGQTYSITMIQGLQESKESKVFYYKSFFSFRQSVLRLIPSLFATLDWLWFSCFSKIVIISRSMSSRGWSRFNPVSFFSFSAGYRFWFFKRYPSLSFEI